MILPSRALRPLRRAKGTHAAEAEPGAFQAHVRSTAKITPTVRLLELQVPGLSTFVPGQWVDLFIPGEPVVGGYSICSTPQDLPTLTLGVKDGRHPPTKWCYNDCAEGDRVEVRPGGTFGLSLDGAAPPADASHFQLPERVSRVVLIAGGIGVNPLLSILRHFAACHASGPRLSEVVVLYGARSREELAFEADIARMAAELPEVGDDSWSCRARALLAAIRATYLCKGNHPPSPIFHSASSREYESHSSSRTAMRV